MNDATRSLSTSASGEVRDPAARPALVILWSADEPGRVGELAWLDAPEGSGALILGRNGTLRWVRPQPGGGELPTGPLGSPRISREQVRIVVSDASILLENVGRCPLLLNGRPAPRCPWVPGALIELQDQMLLRCERRAPLPELTWNPPGAPHPFGLPDEHGLVGETPAMWELRRQIAFCGPLDAHVLLRGPSGSGKELVARALHDRSRRKRSALVSRNAATFPESLIEAELFGNIANFPNPGMPARPGLIGAADGATLFLDEFGELPQAQQARLLRVLDQGEYTRLGDAKPSRADLRLVAATNRPVEVLKPDVLARFPLRLELPGLDQRRADVPLIAAQILRRIARGEPALGRFLGPPTLGAGRTAEAELGPPRFTMALVAALVNHPYTTHVRELEALLWESMRRATGDRLDLWPDYASQTRAGAYVDAGDVPAGDPSVSGPRPAARGPAIDPRSLGPDEIRAALERHGGKQEAAWRELGLSSRHALGRLVRKYGL